MIATPTLKYLFGAHFTDGTEIFQTEEDTSLHVPGRNAYYDLLLHDPDGNVIAHLADGVAVPRPDIELFQLTSEGNTYLVDLRDGHFEINGAPFFLGYPPCDGLLLVFFRRNRKKIKTSFVGGQRKSEVVGEEVEYHMGWATRDKAVQHTLILP